MDDIRNSFGMDAVTRKYLNNYWVFEIKLVGGTFSI